MTVPKSNPDINGQFQIINRIAIEELEAWYFGDITALKYAYPKISINLSNKEAYRDPDDIDGGTWEALERELQNKGYFKDGLRKIVLSKEVSKYLNPLLNRSKSFQVFREGLESITAFSN